MKPIKLKFTAFGPYPTTQTIDFTNLKNSGMFVITGPTGSGKTTIFDAISFALYGSASGSERGAGMFRSDFADDTVQTEVEFEFEIRNKKYAIKRIPSQYRPKLRGEGMRKIDASVTLTTEAGVYSSQTDVSEQIETILGLSKDQFKQIVLLPQGEFKKLLVSDSHSKEKIFRKIFNTSTIKQIQEKMRIETEELKRKIEDAELQITTLLSSYSNITSSLGLKRFETNINTNLKDTQKHTLALQVDIANFTEMLKLEADNGLMIKQLNEYQSRLHELDRSRDKFKFKNDFLKNLKPTIEYDNFKRELKTVQRNLTVNKEKLEVLKQGLTKLNESATESRYKQAKVEFDNLEQHQLLKAELEKKIENINEHKKKQQEVDKFLKQIETTKTELKQEQQIKGDLEQKLEQIKKNAERIEALKLEQLEVELEKRELKQNLETIEEYEKKQFELNSLLEQIEATNTKLKQQQQIKGDLEQKLEQIKKNIERIEILKAEQFEVEQEKQRLEKVLQVVEDIQKLKVALEADCTHARELYNQYNTADERLKTIRLEYFSAQAGNLAKKLKDNEPCPVCGSFEHPTPATLPGALISIEEIDKQEQIVVDLNSKLSEITKLINTNETLIKQQTDEHQIEDIDYSNQYENICSRLGSLEKDISNLVASNKQQEVNEQLEICNNLVSSLTSDIKNYQITVDKLRLELSLSEEDNVIVQHLTNVDYSSQYESICAKFDNIKIRIGKLTTVTDSKEADKKLQSCNDLISKLTSDIKGYEFTVEKLISEFILTEKEVLDEPVIVQHLTDVDNNIKLITSNYNQLQEKFNAEVREKDNIVTNINFIEQSIVQDNEQQKILEVSISSYVTNYGQEKLEQYSAMLADEAQIRRDLEEYNKSVQLVKQKIGEIEEIVKKYTPIDVSATEEKLKVVEKEYKQFSSIEEGYKILSSKVKDDLEQLFKIENKSKADITRYQVIADASDIANGKTISKISFERYMLSMYFKQIITRANIYFKTMTNNRFLLEYKEPQGGRAAQGLDLNIIDNYTSKIRDVKSLSGGESFKAALAMALGLSDIVQMNAGGVQIDTIFIDEGFGSLDSDSLNTVIDTLIEIENEGRMVGIISHVEELKNQISNKIEIESGPSGSKLKVKFN